MFQLLAFIGIFALIFIFIILIVVIRLLFGGLQIFRDLGRGIFGGGQTNNNSSRNGGSASWGRWTSNRGSGSANWGNDSANWGGNTANRNTGKKQSVHDSRTQDTANRKIFDKNEGEYVDFEEVK